MSLTEEGTGPEQKEEVLNKTRKRSGTEGGRGLEQKEEQAWNRGRRS